MTTTSSNRKRAWSKGEKALLTTIIVVFVLAGLGACVYQHDSAMPTAINIPTPAMPQQNAYNFFIAAANAEVQGKAVDNAESHYASGANLTLAQKAALVQANTPALRLLRHGLTLPYQAPPVRSYLVNPLPGDAGFREVARLLMLQERVDQAQGNWAGATDAGLDAVQEGSLIQQNSPLLGTLVGMACEAIGRVPLWTSIDHLTATQAEAAARRTEHVEAQQISLADMLQQEEWTGQASMLQLLSAPNWQQGLAQGMFSSNGAGLSSGLGFGFQQSLHLLLLSRRQIYADYTRYMNTEIREARLPYTPNGMRKPPTTGDPFSDIMAIDYHAGRIRVGQEEAENGLLSVALALRAYRLQHGAYPTTLTALVPAYLSHVPADPFAVSGFLHYRQQGNKYVLYSIGPDGKDDGGKPIFDASQHAPKPGDIDRRYTVQNDSKGDIVAGVNL